MEDGRSGKRRINKMDKPELIKNLSFSEAHVLRNLVDHQKVKPFKILLTVVKKPKGKCAQQERLIEKGSKDKKTSESGKEIYNYLNDLTHQV